MLQAVFFFSCIFRGKSRVSVAGRGVLKNVLQNMRITGSETGRIRFRGVRFQTPNSVSFFGLTEFG